MIWRRSGSSATVQHQAGKTARYGPPVPVPDYETLMGPTLVVLADGQPRTRTQLRDAVAPLAGVDGEISW